MPHEDITAIRQQFNRRFAFGLHATISSLISLIMLFLAFTHPLNMAMWDGRLVWAGYARPDLIYAACFLFGLVGLHAIWLLRREERINQQRLVFSLHMLLLIVTGSLTLTYLASWYFDESYKWVDFYAPASPSAPPALIIYALLLITIVSLLAFPIHSIRLIYKELLSRTLNQKEKEKSKRDESFSLVDDDGELVEWAENELKAKRLS